MLPKFPPNLGKLPRELKFVRDLEEFDGPILSEFRAEQGGIYLEKWCAHHEGTIRTLVVRTDPRSVAEYLAGRISMLNLLVEPSDGVGFIVDYFRDTITAVYMVRVLDLPIKYLPKPAAVHDKSLRPDWDVTPQSFLIDASWDAKLLAKIEQLYLDVFAFNFFTDPKVDRVLPEGVLTYVYDGGFPIMHAFRRIRAAVPDEMRAKSVGVFANSPGVLTIAAPTITADHLLASFYALQRSEKAYTNLHAWSRLKPQRAGMIPDTAVDDLRRLCETLEIDTVKLLPALASTRTPEPIETLVAGKLIAAYYRKMWNLLSPANGVDFISAAIEEVAPPSLVFEDEDEDDEEWR